VPKPNRKPNYWILIISFILTVIGLVAITSATIVQGARLGDPYHYLKSQMLYGVTGGLIGMFIMSQLSYQWLRKLALPLMLLAVGFLILILLPGIGSKSGTGAQRWIQVYGFHLQPIEAVKLAFFIYIAAWLDQRGESIKKFTQGVIPFILFTSIVSFLILEQPNASNMALILMTSMIVFFVAGARLHHIFLLLTIGAIFGFITLTQADYRLNRLKVYLDPSLDPAGLGYQVNQSILAIGSGGVWGVGLGHSRQKYEYLPAVESDSIFAIISEEMGLVGVCTIIGLFLIFAYQGIKTAEDADDRFGTCLATAITFWLVIQAFINMGAISGLMPLTGIPLPFVSYGSSALVISMTATGILFNISKGDTLKEKNKTFAFQRNKQLN
jgi:cell division protein FtsW